jgi:hypothetical protein
MTNSSRRNFLKYASLGTAAVGVAAVAPSLTGTAAAAEPESNAPAHGGPFVAWVKDPGAGEIAVLVGDRELVYTDKKLAKKLAQAASRAQQK